MNNYIKKLSTKYFVDVASFCQENNLNLNQLPFVSKIFLENMLRAKIFGQNVSIDQIKLLWKSIKKKNKNNEIIYNPARVLMQDFTGVPAILDLVALRYKAKEIGKNPKLINPLCPVDLVIDHSVSVDYYSKPDSFDKNLKLEFKRNKERYIFLKWAKNSFDNLKIIPPGTGICHQINVEYLSKLINNKIYEDRILVIPDTCVGTDSHTTMANGLGVLAWGVGGLEAEAVMLGQNLTLTTPEVVGVKLTGKLNSGVNATDLVLKITQLLREVGVVGKYVEFYGEGVKNLPVPNRLTIANMAPEYGANCGLFPADDLTLDFLKNTGREATFVKQYLQATYLYQNYQNIANYDVNVELDLATVNNSLAGPKRPQDRIDLPKVADLVKQEIEPDLVKEKTNSELHSGDVVIAAITSCTNTSNPALLIAAGLVAQKAQKFGLKTKKWVKTSFAPGSRVAAEYLTKANLLKPLENLGFNIIAYGCTTCIGNSGPLDNNIVKQINDNNLTVSAVLSGNRNFEGRIHQEVKLNFIASPPMVVAYALFGTTAKDITKEPIALDQQGNKIYLKDILPNDEEIESIMKSVINSNMYQKNYADIFVGTTEWQILKAPSGELFDFNDQSTYIKLPPFLNLDNKVINNLVNGQSIDNAKLLFYGADSVTTDHISPAGAIKSSSPAGHYLKSHNVELIDFNSYGSRRGNHEVMMRGTLANIRLKNKLINVEGGNTYYYPDNNEIPIYDAAMKYIANQSPLIILAGKEYGTGSSRDWAAKGCKLLGVVAVVAISFERIHRSNLVAMAVLPLELEKAEDPLTKEQARSLENIEIIPPKQGLDIKSKVEVVFNLSSGDKIKVLTKCRLDTKTELKWFKKGGIMPAFFSDN